MSKEIANSVDEVLSGTAPVERGIVKAVSHLLAGVIDIPSALLRRPTQAIDDVTVSRSIVSEILARKVAEDAASNPEIMEAASEIYLPPKLRKTRNKIQVARKVIEHVAQGQPDENVEQAAAPDADWMNSFMRFAEDASSEQLQDLFGRILSGEVSRPGSFSLTTLRTVAELDREIANDFTAMWTKSVGDGVDDASEFHLGEWFDRWSRLTEAGLMLPTVVAQYRPDGDVWAPISVRDTSLLVYLAPESAPQWTSIKFTRTGRQLGSIISPPDYRANIRSAGQRLVAKKFPGIVSVELHTNGKPVERLS